MKPFVILSIGVAIWGASLGVAFIGGLAVGSTQSEEPAAEAVAFPDPAGAPSGDGQLSQEQLQQLRQRIQSGEATQEEIDRIRQQFRGAGGGQGGQGGAGRGGRGGQFGGGGGQPAQN